MTKEYSTIEMDLAFGSAKPYGSNRSIVRRIASSLPFKPCPRVHFQLHPYTEEASLLNGSRRQNGLVACLADVGWMEGEDEQDAGLNGIPRLGASSGLVFRNQQAQASRRPLTRQRSLPSLNQGDLDPQGQTTVNNEAIQKISALETELAKLRAQIAQIVLAQEQNTQPAAPSSGVPPPPPPCAPPPPPPPPPPPLPIGLQRSFSTIDLIKERRGKRSDSVLTVLDEGPKPTDLPSMLDVLKDIGKVKLRSVKGRSEEAKAKACDPTDAASLIAEALKRKFAHRYRHDSQEEDKEFNLPAPEVKARPEAPLFGQHMLKSTGKRRVL